MRDLTAAALAETLQGARGAIAAQVDRLAPAQGAAEGQSARTGPSLLTRLRRVLKTGSRDSEEMVLNVNAQ